MPEPVALSIDQGTHATRTMLVDKNGHIRFSSFVEISLSSRHDHVEQDPEELLASVTTTIQRAVNYSPKIGPIMSAGLATQRSSIVAWDRRSGTPLTPVISWQDRRAADSLVKLLPKAKKIKMHTGLPLSAHYGASKARWLLENVPIVKNAQKGGYLAWGPVSSFLLFHLLESSPWIVDHVNAQRTHLLNLQSLSWDPFMLDLFNIPSNLLPSLKPTGYDYGPLKICGSPLAVVTGDQQAAFFSIGAPQATTAIINLGTGAFILLDTGENLYQHSTLLSGLSKTTQAHRHYLLEGTVNGAGAALTWAEKTWAIPDVMKYLPAWLSDDIHPPVFINTVGGLGSPWWQPQMTPRLIGDGTAAERIVAVAESILFLIYANLSAITNVGIEISRLQVTGGLSAVDGLCQRLADLTGKEVYRPSEKEATARGVAWLAFGCPGTWPSPDLGHTFRPVRNKGLQNRFSQFCEHMPAP